MNAVFYTKIEIRSEHTVPLTVYFEPWAEELTLEPEAVLEVHSACDVDSPLQIEFHDHAVVVFGGPTHIATMKAFRSGQLVWESYEQLPPPPST